MGHLRTFFPRHTLNPTHHCHPSPRLLPPVSPTPPHSPSLPPPLSSSPPPKHWTLALRAPCPESLPQRRPYLYFLSLLPLTRSLHTQSLPAPHPPPREWCYSTVPLCARGAPRQHPTPPQRQPCCLQSLLQHPPLLPAPAPALRTPFPPQTLTQPLWPWGLPGHPALTWLPGRVPTWQGGLGRTPGREGPPRSSSWGVRPRVCPWSAPSVPMVCPRCAPGVDLVCPRFGPAEEAVHEGGHLGLPCFQHLGGPEQEDGALACLQETRRSQEGEKEPVLNNFVAPCRPFQQLCGLFSAPGGPSKERRNVLVPGKRAKDGIGLRKGTRSTLVPGKR